MSLKRKIDRCIAAKEGNKEFALFCTDGVWTAMIGNTMLSIRLGETEGEVIATGATAIEAIDGLLSAVREWKPKADTEAEDFLAERGLLGVEII